MTRSVAVHHAQPGSIVIVASGHTTAHLAIAWRHYLIDRGLPPEPEFRDLLTELEASQRAWVATATRELQPDRLQDLVAAVSEDASSAGAYTTAEVADQLGCSRQWVDKLRLSGALPAVRHGRTFHFPKGQVDAFKARRMAG